MTAFRTLVHPWQARIQATQLLHHSPSPYPFMSRFLSVKASSEDSFPDPQTRPPCQRQKLGLLVCERVSPAHATLLSRSRAFNSASLESLTAVLKVLKQFLGSGEKACQALAMSPGILVQQSELLAQKLTVLAHFGTREKVVRKVCITPRILSPKLDSLHKTLSSIEEIGLSMKARNKLLSSPINIFSTPGALMLHAFDFLKSLGLSARQISRSLERQPTLLVSSPDNLIERYFLLWHLGFTANEFAKATCAGLPPLTVGTLQPKIKLLEDQGFSKSDVRMLISRYPCLISLGCDSLKSKLDFLLCKQNYAIADIVKYPLCLSLSLQDRLIPRLEAVKEKGLFKVYALSTILKQKDVVFQELLSRWKRQ